LHRTTFAIVFVLSLNDPSVRLQPEIAGDRLDPEHHGIVEAGPPFVSSEALGVSPVGRES